jgi:adenine specific DNA methylase Mod
MKSLKEPSKKDFKIIEEINRAAFCKIDSESINAKGEYNLLACCDNLNFMKYLLDEKGMQGKLKMIYIDPPFFSKANYDAVINLKNQDGEKIPPIKCFAYGDIWQRDMAEYLKMLVSRLSLMKALLANDGTIWVHLDWHIVHYVKIFMDEIFGSENFVNEIIWQYKSGGSGKNHFARKHDTILVYSKSKKYKFSPPKEKSYNRDFKPYRFRGVEEFQDNIGWYTMVTMKDVWNIDMVGRTSSERTGYATQKPESLLERIMLTATNEGDLCADFFCGSGTMASVAEKHNRQWICCDSNEMAVSSTLKRLYNKNINIRLMEEVSKEEAANIKKNIENSNILEFSKPLISVKRKLSTREDKDTVHIYLEKYCLNKFPNNIDAKGRAALANIQKNNSLQLIDYWSVDFNYDGEIYRPKVIFAKEKGIIETSCTKKIDRDAKICVKIVDVFGNSSLQEF